MRQRNLFLCVILCFIGLLLYSGCAKNTPIKIGYTGALSGPNSEVSIGGRNAMQLLVDQVNGDGGINGRQLELMILDDEDDLEKVAEIDRTFIKNNVIAVIGHDMSYKLPTILDAIRDQPILMISPTMTDYSVSGLDDNLLRIVITNYDQGVALAQYAMDHDEEDAFLVIADSVNESYGKGVVAGFEDCLGASIDVFKIEGDMIRDTEQIVAKYLAGGYKGVLMVLKSKDVAYLSQRIKSIDPGVHLYSANWGMTQDVIALGGDAIEGTRFVSMIDFELQTEEYLEFIKVYKEHYRVTPGFPAIYAYEAGQVLIEAIQKSSKLSASALKTVILEQSQFHTIQGDIVFDAFGDVSRKAVIYTVVDGQFKKTE